MVIRRRANQQVATLNSAGIRIPPPLEKARLGNHDYLSSASRPTRLTRRRALPSDLAQPCPCAVQRLFGSGRSLGKRRQCLFVPAAEGAARHRPSLATGCHLRTSAPDLSIKDIECDLVIDHFHGYLFRDLTLVLAGHFP